MDRLSSLILDWPRPPGPTVEPLGACPAAGTVTYLQTLERQLLHKAILHGGMNTTWNPFPNPLYQNLPVKMQGIVVDRPQDNGPS